MSALTSVAPTPTMAITNTDVKYTKIKRNRKETHVLCSRNMEFVPVRVRLTTQSSLMYLHNGNRNRWDTDNNS